MVVYYAFLVVFRTWQPPITSCFVLLNFVGILEKRVMAEWLFLGDSSFKRWCHQHHLQ